MFENQTYESILQRMLDRVSDSLDKREGSVIWDTHSPTALEFQNLYLELENMLQEAYGDTASREFLIRRAKGYEYSMVQYGKDEFILAQAAENADMKQKVTDTQLALVEVYELMA